MKRDLLPLLCCPSCRGDLDLADARDAGGEVEAGLLRCRACAAEYPVVNGIPRFVPAENYAGSFGYQWNRFPRTQLDSYSGLPITRERFFAQSGWTPEEMRGRVVLDVGCGSGRFAEVALSTGARVVAADYSSAADACRANLGGDAALDVVQADVFRLPFRHEAFDFVYCFGVLQHTPDPRRAFLALAAPLRRGGRLAVDVYPKLWMNLFWPKYWLRPFTRRMNRERLFAVVERMVRWLLPLSRAAGRIPLLGRRLRWLVPVANYEGIYPLSETQIREWSVLDTFDMLSPAHDHPQSPKTLAAWLAEAGLRDAAVLRTGHLVGRGTKP
jgi:SAM-dependent methyltransferase